MEPSRVAVKVKVKDRAWTQGYFCAVAVLLRESGLVTSDVRSLFKQGGPATYADEHDIALFVKYKLM